MRSCRDGRITLFGIGSVFAHERAIMLKAKIRTYPTENLRRYSRQKGHSLLYRLLCDEELERREVRDTKQELITT